MTTIKLMIEDGMWVAEWCGDEEARVRVLFGTNVVPTPFAARSDAEMVRGEIVRLNPNCNVELVSKAAA